MMDRKQFLGSLFALAALEALPKVITQQSSNQLWMMGVDPYDTPGMSGKASVFRIKLNKRWFRNGDVLAVGSLHNKYYYSIDPAGIHTVTEMDKEKPITWIVEDFDSRAAEEGFVNRAMKLFSTVKS